MRYFLFLVAFLGVYLSGCAPQTKALHITYYGEDDLKDEAIAPMQDQIDAAAVAAAILAGVNDEHLFEDRLFMVAFHAGPIAWNGRLYAGLTGAEVMRVMFVPNCLFASQSALLHEMFHRMLGIAHNGDMDQYHTDTRWQIVPNLAAALAEHYCPLGSVPVAPFSPQTPAYQGSIR